MTLSQTTAPTTTDIERISKMKRKNKKYNWTDVSQMVAKGFQPGQVFRMNANGQEIAKIRAASLKRFFEESGANADAVKRIKNNPYLMLDCSQITFVSSENGKDVFAAEDGREFSIPFATNSRDAHQFLKAFSPVS